MKKICAATMSLQVFTIFLFSSCSSKLSPKSQLVYYTGIEGFNMVEVDYYRQSQGGKGLYIEWLLRHPSSVVDTIINSKQLTRQVVQRLEISEFLQATNRFLELSNANFDTSKLIYTYRKSDGINIKMISTSDKTTSLVIVYAF